MLSNALCSRKIQFTTNADEAIPSAEIVFIAVGTPSTENGKADLSELFSAVTEIAMFIRKCKTIVIKSSVPPGTTKVIHDEIMRIVGCTKDINGLQVIYNPEFLREGSAVDDFLSPNRIVVGADNKAASDILFSLYRPLLRHSTAEIFTSPLNAELIKYASNSYLAVRLSFINELAGLCEKIGGNIKEVAYTMGLDHRIGKEYLSAGLGYGGACLPKDTRALSYIAQNVCAPLTVLESAISANCSIAHRLANRVSRYVPYKGTIAIWGLSFKAGTEDIRNSPVLSLIEELTKLLDCKFQIFDPTGNEFKDNYPKELLKSICQTPAETLSGADALIIGTAWDQFKKIDLKVILPHMHGTNVFDFANALEKSEVQCLGLKYHTCGEI